VAVGFGLDQYPSANRGSTPVASHLPANAPKSGPIRIKNNGFVHVDGMSAVNSSENRALPRELGTTAGVSMGSGSSASNGNTFSLLRSNEGGNLAPKFTNP